MNYLVYTQEVDGIRITPKSWETYDEARQDYLTRIGKHVSYDDALPMTFYMKTLHRDADGAIIDVYTFNGFAKPQAEKANDRPMHCPMCKEELDLYEDVEEWTDATIVHKWDGEAFCDRQRDDYDMADSNPRVYCRHCGDTMPLDEWRDAYESRP